MARRGRKHSTTCNQDAQGILVGGQPLRCSRPFGHQDEEHYDARTGGTFVVDPERDHVSIDGVTLGIDFLGSMRARALQRETADSLDSRIMESILAADDRTPKPVTVNHWVSPTVLTVHDTLDDVTRKLQLEGEAYVEEINKEVNRKAHAEWMADQENHDKFSAMWDSMPHHQPGYDERRRNREAFAKARREYFLPKEEPEPALGPPPSPRELEDIRYQVRKAQGVVDNQLDQVPMEVLVAAHRMPAMRGVRYEHVLGKLWPRIRRAVLGDAITRVRHRVPVDIRMQDYDLDQQTLIRLGWSKALEAIGREK